MSRFIVGQDRTQCLLFPERLDGYVDKDNPVQVVDAFVEALNFKTLRFERTEPKATGRPGYDASTLLKIYIYGYLNRIPSSRRLELETRRNKEDFIAYNSKRPDRCGRVELNCFHKPKMFVGHEDLHGDTPHALNLYTRRLLK